MFNTVWNLVYVGLWNSLGEFLAGNRFLGVSTAASLGLGIYPGLAPIWALWLGMDLLRKPVLLENG